MKTVENALKNSGLSDEFLTALRQESKSLKIADFRYNPSEPKIGNNLFKSAEAGIDNAGGSPFITVYRGARTVFGTGGEPSKSGYGFSSLRAGRKGFLDLIHHEGAHMTQHLMFRQRDDGTYRKPFGASKERKAHMYMKFLREYE